MFLTISSYAIFLGDVFYDASEDLPGTMPIDNEDTTCNGMLAVEDSYHHRLRQQLAPTKFPCGALFGMTFFTGCKIVR